MTDGITGLDPTEWTIRRAVLRAANRICRGTPSICPTPRLRQVPSRIAA